MSVTVITPPSPIVSLPEVKRHLRVDHVDDDALIESYTLAATTWLDGPSGWLGRALGAQELEYSGFWGCSLIELPCRPVAEIISVTVTASDGTDVVVAPNEYSLDGGCVVVAPGATWATMRNQRIRYLAGYGKMTDDETPKWVNASVPEPVRVAIMMLVAQWYQTRSSVVIGAPVNSLPFAVDALLNPYRVYR